MKITARKVLSVAIFLLMYYIYMNSVRKVMIPMSGVLVPVLLAAVLGICIWAAKGEIHIKKNADQIWIFSWILIAVYILFHNEDVASNLIGGGMIQLYVMICFLIYTVQSDEWSESWFIWTEVFVMIHALATVIFYYNSSLYSQFARYFFSGETLTDCLRYYRNGWMCGLSSHFSSNGMILATGLLIFFERSRFMRKTIAGKKKRGLLFHDACAVIVLYALILSSKRSPLISAGMALVITYIFAEGKDVWKRLIILTVVCLVGYVFYKQFASLIPGLSTIVDKFNKLENTNAGILNGRGGLWMRAIEMFQENPLIGKGFGSYAVYAAATDAITTSAHNYYLQILAELGIVGLILYLTAFGSGALAALHEMKFSRKKQDERELMALSISLDLQIYVLIYCMTSTAMMYYYVLIPYFLACATTRAIQFKRQKNKTNQEGTANESRNSYIY